MAKKYNFSVQRLSSIGMSETFQVEGCDSFDEAIQVVEKAVRDRKLLEPQGTIQTNAKPLVRPGEDENPHDHGTGTSQKTESPKDL